MTWAEGLFAHLHQGHDEFLKRAGQVNKWRIFIWNVCTELNCSHREPIESKEN